LEENAKSRKAYLPEGDWVTFFTGVKVKGGCHINTDIAGDFPVFIRSGKGIALDLGPDKGLHFILAGDKGQYRFRDDSSSDFTIRWDGNTVDIPENVTFERKGILK